MDRFIVKKNIHKKTDNQPDYIISFNDGQNWIDWGAGWIKTDKRGGKFISCQKSKPKEEKSENEPSKEQIAEIFGV